MKKYLKLSCLGCSGLIVILLVIGVIVSMFEDEDSNGDSSTGPLITFGDDLDVPAFIRNRKE